MQRSRFIFGDFIHPNMNKDAYRILTEKVSFPGLHRLIRNAVVLCWKEKKTESETLRKERETGS